MSELADITGQIADTQTAIKRLQDSLQSDPSDQAARLMLVSLENRQQTLEGRFLEASNRDHLDVCSYRIFNEESETYSIQSIGSALSDFQRWYTLLFDSLVNGRKEKARVSAEALENSRLNFAFTYPGSVGVVMTIPVERLMVFEHDLEKAMKLLIEMLTADSSDQIHYFAKTLGPGVIRALSSWVSTHANAEIGAEIQWTKGDSKIAEFRATASHIKNLQQAIGETSDIEEKEIKVKGYLVGADINSHSFHMVFDDADEIRGSMAETIGAEFTVQLPRQYKATILRSSSCNYATDKETVSYYLTNLDEV